MSPKSMTQKEKEHVKNRFYEKGKELLLSLGVKKTNVEDITRAAGMSKGSFYLYFTSKEEFFFDIFDGFHKKFKEEAFKAIGGKKGDDLRNSLKGLLMDAFMNEENAAFYLRSADLEYLLYKLPPEQIASHLAEDNDMIIELIKHGGITMEENDAMVLSNLMKTIFLTRCSGEMLNEKVMERTIEVLVEASLDFLFSKGKFQK